MAKSPLELSQQFATLKPRDDAYNQKMQEFHNKRKELLDSKPSKYLEPEWNALSKEIQQFRSGYEPSKIDSPYEYLLDNDIDEFQIDQVRDDISLEDLYTAMQNGDDFYKIASRNGQGFDSAVREKIFDGISRKLGIDYDDIYNTWLGRKKRQGTEYDLDNGNPNPYKSKLLAKYPDKYNNLKKQSPALNDETLDVVAKALGIDLD